MFYCCRKTNSLWILIHESRAPWTSSARIVYTFNFERPIFTTFFFLSLYLFVYFFFTRIFFFFNGHPVEVYRTVLIVRLFSFGLSDHKPRTQCIPRYSWYNPLGTLKRSPNRSVRTVKLRLLKASDRRFLAKTVVKKKKKEKKTIKKKKILVVILFSTRNMT